MAALALFAIQDLTYYYPESENPALKGIDLTIEEGEFLLVAGGSGSGKSSLARALARLIPDFYGGRLGGKITFRGRDLGELSQRQLAREVGMVFQDPEKQLVMTSVEAELAFGLENLGLPRPEMARRLAEIESFFNLGGMEGEFTANLSGGQKQKLALASVMAMQPQVLILDEPTSQLDPVAAEDLFNLVKRLNEEMGLTIVLIEQRLERCYHLADRVVLMAEGQVIHQGSPSEAASWAARQEVPLAPPVARFFGGLGFEPVPVTIKEGRQALRQCLRHPQPGLVDPEKTAGPPAKLSLKAPRQEPARPLLCLDRVWYTYPNGTEALREVSLAINPGELVVILGPNGAGKSTVLRVMAGILKPGRGKRQLADLGLRVAYLSQNPSDYLLHDQVEAELRFTLDNFGLEGGAVIDKVLKKLGLEACRQSHPRDLSSGERQRVALASVLVAEPQILLLDEPTRGMDYRLKAELGEILRGVVREGTGVVLITHDVEFAAEYGDRVIMMSSGRVVSDGPKHQVLGQSFFYTTQMGKMCRGYAQGVLTLAEARAALAPYLEVTNGLRESRAI